jgi:hypothetical protein
VKLITLLSPPITALVAILPHPLKLIYLESLFSTQNSGNCTAPEADCRASSLVSLLELPHRLAPSFCLNSTNFGRTPPFRGTLPNIKWFGITMTMPYQLWTVFRDNQQLLTKLPALGAHAIDESTRSHAGAVPFLLTIMQTYNGELIFKPHLHIICSEGGMDTGKSNWIDNMGLESAFTSIMELWRAKVVDYLAEAYRKGFVKKSVSKRFLKDIEWQRTRDWHLWIEARSKYDLLNYDGRYVSRPPIAEQNIKNVTEVGVQFIAKVYPGENANPIGSQRKHPKIEMPVSLDLLFFQSTSSNPISGSCLARQCLSLRDEFRHHGALDH